MEIQPSSAQSNRARYRALLYVLTTEDCRLRFSDRPGILYLAEPGEIESQMGTVVKGGFWAWDERELELYQGC